MSSDTRNTATFEDDEVSVLIDGQHYYLTHMEEAWWVGSGGNVEHFHSGHIAAQEFRYRVETAMLEQYARRRWERSFRQWITGCELYDAGAPVEECATPGQARGWNEQREYRERRWQAQLCGDDASYMPAGFTA